MKSFRQPVRMSLFAAPLLLSGAAFAGGLAEPVGVAAPIVLGGDWTGFYLGGQLGQGRVDFSDETETSFALEGEDYGMEGLIYGLHAGYLYDFGSFVAGLEMDYDDPDLELEVDDSETGIGVDSIARAQLLAGYDAGVVLPYLVGGVVAATLQDDADIFTLDGRKDTGRFLGAGAAYAASESIRVGAEVLQHSFEDFDSTGEDFDVTTASLKVSFAF